MWRKVAGAEERSRQEIIPAGVTESKSLPKHNRTRATLIPVRGTAGVPGGWLRLSASSARIVGILTDDGDFFLGTEGPATSSCAARVPSPESSCHHRVVCADTSRRMFGPVDRSTLLGSSENQLNMVKLPSDTDRKRWAHCQQTSEQTTPPSAKVKTLSLLHCDCGALKTRIYGSSHLV
ncbi:unnamed protein product [Pleuronectes platessa]|uniref:Uncharacterized protein n=1 Tax=Pleuronectes platessa TaxID=8262 RepID=A0A9N7TKM2_PLEPL|nr:unnamed protein product [Pleuronectes platessa]